MPKSFLDSGFYSLVMMAMTEHRSVGTVMSDCQTVVLLYIHAFNLKSSGTDAGKKQLG